MNKAIAALQSLTKAKYDTNFDDCPSYKRGTDVFAINGDRLCQTIIRKDKAMIRDEIVNIRRVFVRYTLATAYSNIGWVLNQDAPVCMVCSVVFYFYKRKFHCYICGDCVCKECCKGSLLISEFKEYGYVPACSNCAYGQDEVSIKVVNPQIQAKAAELLKTISPTTSPKSEQSSHHIEDDELHASVEMQASRAHAFGVQARNDELRRQEIEAAEALVYQQMEEANFKKMKEREKKRMDMDMDIKRRHSVQSSSSSPVTDFVTVEETEEYLLARKKKYEEDARRAAQVMADLEAEHEASYMRLYQEQQHEKEEITVPSDKKVQLENRLRDLKKSLISDQLSIEKTITVENFVLNECSPQKLEMVIPQEDSDHTKNLMNAGNLQANPPLEEDSIDIKILTRDSESPSTDIFSPNEISDDVVNEEQAAKDIQKLKMTLEATANAAMLKKKKKKAAKLKAMQEMAATQQAEEESRLELIRKQEEQAAQIRIEAEKIEIARIAAEQELAATMLTDIILDEYVLQVIEPVAKEEVSSETLRYEAEKAAEQKAARLAAYEAAVEEATRSNKAREEKKREQQALKERMQEEEKAKLRAAEIDKKKRAQEAAQAEKERLRIEKEKYKAEKMEKLRLQLDLAKNFESNIASLKAEHEAGEESARQIAAQRAAEVYVGTMLEVDIVDMICNAVALECITAEQHVLKLKESMKAEAEREEREAEAKLQAEREKNRELAKFRKEERRKAREEALLKSDESVQVNVQGDDTSNSLSTSALQYDQETNCKDFDVPETEQKLNTDREVGALPTSSLQCDQEVKYKDIDVPEAEQKLITEREARAKAARQRKLARKMSRQSQGSMSGTVISPDLEIITVNEPYKPIMTFVNINNTDGSIEEEKIKFAPNEEDSDLPREREDSIDLEDNIIVGTETFNFSSESINIGGDCLAVGVEAIMNDMVCTIQDNSLHSPSDKGDIDHIHVERDTNNTVSELKKEQQDSSGNSAENYERDINGIDSLQQEKNSIDIRHEIEDKVSELCNDGSYAIRNNITSDKVSKTSDCDDFRNLHVDSVNEEGTCDNSKISSDLLVERIKVEEAGENEDIFTEINSILTDLLTTMNFEDEVPIQRSQEGNVKSVSECSEQQDISVEVAPVNDVKDKSFLCADCNDSCVQISQDVEARTVDILNEVTECSTQEPVIKSKNKKRKKKKKSKSAELQCTKMEKTSEELFETLDSQLQLAQCDTPIDMLDSVIQTDQECSDSMSNAKNEVPTDNNVKLNSLPESENIANEINEFRADKTEKLCSDMENDTSQITAVENARTVDDMDVVNFCQDSIQNEKVVEVDLNSNVLKNSEEDDVKKEGLSGLTENCVYVDYKAELVMKSMLSEQEGLEKKKIFLNVCSHKDIPGESIVIGLNCPQMSKDKSGDDTLVYDICVNSRLFSGNKSVEEVCSRVLNYLNSLFLQQKAGRIDMVYKIPKIKNQFKGSHSAIFEKVA